jgi:hypothetical protein
MDALWYYVKLILGFPNPKSCNLINKSTHKKLCKERGVSRCNCKRRGIRLNCACGLSAISCMHCSEGDTYNMLYCDTCI